ncbi:unnamed protein product [Brassica oleracea var. botrytis]
MWHESSRNRLLMSLCSPQVHCFGRNHLLSKFPFGFLWTRSPCRSSPNCTLSSQRS